MTPGQALLERLHYHVTRAIERGAEAIVEQRRAPGPLEEAIDAVRAARAKLGRNYKRAIRGAWRTGNYDREGLGELSGELQRARNRFGPTWLERLRLK
jgi:hypothetical protein